MAYMLSFNIAAQVIAAFVIFVFGYVALLSSLLICAAVAKGLYEGGIWVRALASGQRPAG
ncbi:MAG: hypothetical protein WB987_06425 [Candidatus Acidiferrales bacterium]